MQHSCHAQSFEFCGKNIHIASLQCQYFVELHAEEGRLTFPPPISYAVQVLKQVYANHENIDDELVQSIVLPANDKNAAAIFYRVITGWGQPVNNILDQLQVGKGLDKDAGRMRSACQLF